MTFLPIVERELRTAARLPVTRRVRWIAAGLALIVWFLFSTFGSNLTTPQRAEAIFGTVSVFSLGFAMLAGVFLTSDCLSEERREGTLGLLFLTDLKGHDVVLGKLASTSLHSIYGLLAVVPIMALPLLMGGVTVGELMRHALVLGVTLFFSLSAGMFVSAVNHDSRAAFVRTLGIVLLLSGVLPLLWWAQWFLFRAVWLDCLLWPSPGFALRCADDAYYATRSGANSFWSSVSVIAGFGLMFLGIASLLLPRVWQQARDEAGQRPPKPGRSVIRTRHGTSRVWLDSKPFYWLATRDDRVGRWAGWFVGIALFVWMPFCVGAWSPRGPGQVFTIMLFVAFAMHVVFKCLVAAEATRRLSEDRHSGALELLLVTPLSPAEIIAGQKAALAHLFRWPRRMLIGMNLVLIWMMMGPERPGWMGSSDRAIFATMFIGGIVLLLTDCFVIGPMGIWCALTTKRHARAILRTIRNLLLPCWLAIFLFWFVAMTASGLNSGTVQSMVIIWMVVGILVDFAAWSWTKSRLDADFRELAATGKSSLHERSRLSRA